MQDFIRSIESEFKNNSNLKNAIAQKQYMKNKFEFFGIKAPKRREIQKPFLIKAYLPPKSELEKIVKTLWQKPQRELYYFVQEFTQKYIKQLEKEDIELLEYLIVNKSWWDTVDFIAVNLVGEYFKKYPQQRDDYIKKWLQSGNIWLQRTSLIFQLKYKTEIDIKLLTNSVQHLLGTKEFFINKAIGWILREYSKTNPDWVLEFVNKTALSNLSRREAIRLIK